MKSLNYKYIFVLFVSIFVFIGAAQWSSEVNAEDLICGHHQNGQENFNKVTYKDWMQNANDSHAGNNGVDHGVEIIRDRQGLDRLIAKTMGAQRPQIINFISHLRLDRNAGIHKPRDRDLVFIEFQYSVAQAQKLILQNIELKIADNHNNRQALPERYRLADQWAGSRHQRLVGFMGLRHDQVQEYDFRLHNELSELKKYQLEIKNSSNIELRGVHVIRTSNDTLIKVQEALTSIKSSGGRVRRVGFHRHNSENMSTSDWISTYALVPALDFLSDNERLQLYIAGFRGVHPLVQPYFELVQICDYRTFPTTQLPRGGSPAGISGNR